MAGFNFDTDAPVAEPWDFPVTVGGVAYATREPTLAELFDMNGPVAAGDMAAALAFVAGLFVGDPPPPASLTFDRVVPLLVALLGYCADRMVRVQGQMKDAARRAESLAVRQAADAGRPRQPAN